MYKLLVVDDETETRTTLCNYFPWDEFGFEIVSQQEDGAEALNYLMNHPVDVLLCDINMPVMNGLELLQEMKKKDINPIVIILTGMRDIHYAQEAIKIGTVDNYLLKPTKYHDFSLVFSGVKEKLDLLHKEKKENSSPDLGSRNERIVQTIKEYISDNLKDVTLEEIGLTVHMNPNYVSQFFKEYSGTNFSTYLTEQKMKKAAELLLDLDFRIYEVSDAVGYSTPRNFARAFKKHYGVTPSEYCNLGGKL